MLNLVFVKNPKEKKDLFRQWMLNGGSADKTWIVSDLTSKIAFQNELFEEKNIVPDESLLRAQELWIFLTKRLRGDLKFISSETAQMYARQILASSEVEWHRRPGVSQLILNYLHILIPILTHENNSEAVKDFFTKNVDSFNKWGHWYLLAKDIFERFKQDKIILPTWSSSVLINEEGFNDVWKRKLIFDLGGQLQPIEGELILHLSKFLDVEVIVPNPSWKEEYSKALKSYDLLISGKVPKVEEDKLERSNQYYKLTTQLAEIQNICSSLRKNIEEGSLPQKIAICAPDIGIYWPVLVEYLKAEGIPYQRKIQSPLKTFPEIMNWLARLKIESGQLKYSELETRVYADTSGESFETDIPLNYTNFHSLYSNLYEEADINRSTKVSKLFSLKKVEDTLGVQDFLTWAMKFWKESWSQERLTTLIDRLYSETSVRMSFDVKEWVSLLDNFAAKLEVTTDEGYAEGLHCIDLVSLKDLDVEHVYLLGLTDQALRSVSTTLIGDSDIERLKLDYGFVIAEPERTELEFEVRWNLDNPKVAFMLSYPQTNFDGDQMSPSVVWLAGAVKQYGNEIPIRSVDSSRLMQIQNSDYNVISTLRNWKDSQVKLKRVNEDLGLEASKWALEGHLDKISASQVEDYLNCPFINASKKIFCLVDVPDIDLDIDYLTRGKLLHGVAELIYSKYPDLNFEPSQIPELFEQVMSDLETPVFDKNIWKGQKAKYIKMIENFVVFEKEWRKKFPAVKTVLHEQKFSVFVNIDSGEIVEGTSGGTVELRGRIDRIEVDEKDNTCIVVDYKFSSDSYSHHNRWIEKNELQLALYSMAIERGALNKHYEVSGAVYYGFKNLNRSKGMLVSGAEGGMFELNTRSGAKLDLNGKKEVYEAATKAIKNTLAGMKSGEYNPAPKDASDCKSCYWRTLCRAKHLN